MGGGAGEWVGGGLQHHHCRVPSPGRGLVEPFRMRPTRSQQASPAGLISFMDHIAIDSETAVGRLREV